MTLNSLNLINYKKYKEFRLEFTDGLTGIIGRNGAGKSTIFDAIIFALYGNIRGEKSTIRNVNATTKEPVIVELSFEIDSKEYRVKRELRGKNLTAKAAIYSDKEKLLSEGAKEVNRYITKLVGMSEDAFKHTIFASQKELTALSSLKNEDRKKIIRKLLGLEKIDKIELEIRNRLRELKSEINAMSNILLTQEDIEKIQKSISSNRELQNSLNKKLEKIKIDLEDKSKVIEKLQNDLKNWQELKDDFTTLDNKLKIAKNSLKNYINNRELKEKSIKELEKKELIYNKNRGIKDDFNTLLKLLEEHQQNREKFLQKEGLEKEQVVLREQFKSAKDEIKSLKDALTIEPKLKETQAQIDKTLKEEKQKLQNLEQQERELREELAKYKTLLDNNSKQLKKIEHLGKESNCPTCTRPLLSEYDLVTKTLKYNINSFKDLSIETQNRLNIHIKEIKKQKNDISKLEYELKEIESNLNLLNSKRDMLNKKESEFKLIKEKGLSNKNELDKLGNLNYDANAHKIALKRKKELEPQYKELIELEPLIAQIPKLKDELGNITKDIDNTDILIKELESKLSKHKYNKELHLESENRYKESIEQKDTLLSQFNKISLEHSKIKGQIDTLQSQLNRDKEQRDVLLSKEEDRVDYEKLKAFMGEFKNRINSQISPRISHFASEMYSKITRGKYQHIEVTNEFDFFIYDDSVRYPIERFSGGEIDLANLVLRIAISKVLSELNSSSQVGFLAFDEVFGSQDEERRFEIMDAFHTIKEQYRQIFLISHEREIKEMFERVIEL